MAKKQVQAKPLTKFSVHNVEENPKTILLEMQTKDQSHYFVVSRSSLVKLADVLQKKAAAGAPNGPNSAT